MPFLPSFSLTFNFKLLAENAGVLQALKEKKRETNQIIFLSLDLGKCI